jgi:hypothetical protein
MNLPAPGDAIAVLYSRNPTSRTDSSLDPCLYFGRVKELDLPDGFLATLMTFDHLPEETHFLWNEEKQQWEDRTFRRPLEAVRFQLDGDLLRHLEDLEALGEHLPDDIERPMDELRMRFLAAAFENGWLAAKQPLVVYSDDLPDARADNAHWGGQKLGGFTVEENRVTFVWPVDGRDESDWPVPLERREDGSFHYLSEEFGDEFTAQQEERASCWLVYGHWDTETERTFFAAVLPKQVEPGPEEEAEPTES